MSPASRSGHIGKWKTLPLHRPEATIRVVDSAHQLRLPGGLLGPYEPLRSSIAADRFLGVQWGREERDSPHTGAPPQVGIQSSTHLLPIGVIKRNIHAVTGDFFETVSMDVLRGRGLDDSDDGASAPHVAVVNETMARLVWPETDALGECLIIADAPCANVVGIVADHHRFELAEDESMHYYIPLARAPYPWPPRELMVRTPSPEILALAIRQRLRDALPAVRLVSATPYSEVIDPQYRSWELGTRLFAAFGGLGLLVASLGLFSVLAFDVTERRPELGIRSALGATRLRMIALVLGNGLRLATAGVFIGISAALIAGRRAEDMLFGVSPGEPSVLAGVGLMTLAVAIVASGLPAWRAARIGPNEALRGE